MKRRSESTEWNLLNDKTMERYNGMLHIKDVNIENLILRNMDCQFVLHWTVFHFTVYWIVCQFVLHWTVFNFALYWIVCLLELHWIVCHCIVHWIRCHFVLPITIRLPKGNVNMECIIIGLCIYVWHMIV